MSVQRDPHEELGVSADASMEEIHRAFRRILREHHPDTRPEAAGHDEESDRALQQALAAYTTLRKRHAVRRPSAGTGCGSQELHRAGGTTWPAAAYSPPLQATPVEWLPVTLTRRRPPPYGNTDPPFTVESLIRWLLDQ